MSPLAQDFQPKGSDLLNHVLVGIYDMHAGNGRKPLFLLLMWKIIHHKNGESVFLMPEELSSEKCSAIHRHCREKFLKSPQPLLLFFTFNTKIERRKKNEWQKENTFNVIHY